jgi:hypothetical protein
VLNDALAESFVGATGEADKCLEQPRSRDPQAVPGRRPGPAPDRQPARRRRDDLGETEGQQPFLVLEHAARVTLAQRIRELPVGARRGCSTGA